MHDKGVPQLGIAIPNIPRRNSQLGIARSDILRRNPQLGIARSDVPRPNSQLGIAIMDLIYHPSTLDCRILHTAPRSAVEGMVKPRFHRGRTLTRSHGACLPKSFTLAAKLRTWSRRICAGKLSFVVRGGTAWSQCGGA